MPLLSTDTARALRSAWRRVLHLWRPMAGWTLLVWAAVATVLVPLSSGLLGWQLLRGPRAVVGNEALVGWLLTPLGLLYLLMAGGLALTAAVVRYAGLFHIVTDDMEGRATSVRKTALRLAPRLPALFRLCVVAVAAGLILAVPLGAGLGGIYALFLGAHDINYYLAVRPAEWRYALLAGGLWALVWLLGAAHVAGRIVLALPAYLDGHRPLRTAAARSRELTRGRAARLLRFLAVALALWFVARFLVDAAFFAAASAFIGWLAATTSALRPIVLATAGYAAGTLVLAAVVGYFGFSFVATVLTKFYLEDTDLHQEAPPAPRLAELPGRARSALDPWLRPLRLVPILVMIVVGTVAASGFLLERIPDPHSVSVHAHRAGPPPAPENTLAALELAIRDEADFSEIDAQRTRDGVVILVHDADFMRVAGDPRRVSETDYPALAHLVQRPDDGSPPEERRVATLDEFLERADGRIGLNIELKYYGWDPALAEEVVRLVRDRGMEDQVVIMSLSLEAVRQVRVLAPGITTGYLATVAVGDVSRLDVDFLAVPRPRLTPELLRAADQRDIEVYAWTINRPGAMVELVQRGVSGLITDDPALAVRITRELGEMSALERLLMRFRGVPAAGEG